MFDDNYEIPGAFPAGDPSSMFGGPTAAPQMPQMGRGGGGFASMLDNPMIMGGLMGMSNLRDPNSMSNALQAMMQMRQGNQMMDYRNRALDETSRYHNGSLDMEKAKADLLRQQVQAQMDQQKMVQGMLPGLVSRFQQNGQQPTGATAQVMQQAQPPQGNPAARPDQNDSMTAPVFGNEVQGQSLPPMGQPQPTPGGNNAPQLTSPAQSGMGMDQTPPDVLKQHFLTKVVGVEGGTNPDGSFRTSPMGAIGPSQVMPKTAPEAAKLAGLPFDDNKYRTDPQYNLALGEAYHKKQFDTFGNLPMADAAYNAGPGAVLTAQNRATKMGDPSAWLSFLPQETQNYVRKTTGFTGGMVPQQLTKSGVQEAQQSVDAQAAQAAPQGAPQGIAQVPGLPQVPGMPQQPSSQQGVTAPDDSQRRRDEVAMGLVLTANPATMAEGLKMINAASETKTYNKGQIVTNADGKPIMVDGPPTVQEQFNNSIAAGKDYREALKTAMEVGKYPRELKQMDAQYTDTQAQTAERQAAAAHTTQTVANTNTAAELGNLSMTQAIGSLRQSYENLNKAGAITNTDKSATENALASLVYQSGPGQALGQIVGSKVQTDLNDIAMAKPQLLAGLMHSSGIKSTQMNSDKELQFYVSMATDPKAGYQSNMKALDHLEQYAKWASQHQQATNTTFGAYLSDSGQSVPAAGSGTPPLGSKDNPMTLEQYNKSRK